MFCGKCGASVPDGEEICPFCGERARGGEIVSAEKPKKSFLKLKPEHKKYVIIAALLLLLVAVLIIVISACSTVTPEDIAEDALDAYMDNDADDYFDLYDEDYLRRYYEYNYNAYLRDCEKQKADSDWDSFDEFYKELQKKRRDNFELDTKPDKINIAESLDSKYSELDYEIDDDSISVRQLRKSELSDWQERFDLIGFHGELSEGVKLRLWVSFISADGDQRIEKPMNFYILKVNGNWCLFRCDALYRAQDCDFMFG